MFASTRKLAALLLTLFAASNSLIAQDEPAADVPPVIAPNKVGQLTQLDDYYLAAWVALDNSAQAAVSGHVSQHSQDAQVREYAQGQVVEQQKLLAALRGTLTDGEPGEGEFDFAAVLNEVSGRLAALQARNQQRAGATSRDQRTTAGAAAAASNDTQRQQRVEDRREGREERAEERGEERTEDRTDRVERRGEQREERAEARERTEGREQRTEVRKERVEGRQERAEDRIEERAEARDQRDREQRAETRQQRAEQREARRVEEREAIRQALGAVRDNLPLLLETLGETIEGSEAESTGLAFVELKRQSSEALAGEVIKQLEGEHSDQTYLAYSIAANLNVIATMETAGRHASPELKQIFDEHLPLLREQVTKGRELLASIPK